ncbi:biotin-dependent carboxyltransferase family protein [Catellatospora chokoriensis]|uniref:Allophanate hydrolase n=1 Tax=Catellatospora chokoriensis TaxID=310353 RepID=A0A8J3NU39_9ACTN|nr:biotin-dependent carboxyltransferase family protein [Catellatospora chokoriensis]GIF92667.1 allophanate hydrolase [Catellatospora chokoriensis]
MLEVVGPGPLATVQDLGRVGYAELGVSRSGALDGPALRLANRLVGNPESCAGIEFTYGGASLRAHTSVWCALTGAPAPLSVDGRPVPYGVAFGLPAGARLEIGLPRHGIRSYLAVSGGVAVPAVLGSRSTDTLSGIGPDPLRSGQVLPVGAWRDGSAHGGGTGDLGTAGAAVEPAPIGAGGWGVDFVPVSAPGAEIRLRVRLGPRDDWFTDAGELLRHAYTAGQGDRIGVRLDGPPLARAVPGELPSEGLLAGAIQVPGDGRPLVFLADHPTTGGYPVAGVVHPDDLGLLAQARPGTRVVFHGSQR